MAAEADAAVACVEETAAWTLLAEVEFVALQDDCDGVEGGILVYSPATFDDYAQDADVRGAKERRRLTGTSPNRVLYLIID